MFCSLLDCERRGEKNVHFKTTLISVISIGLCDCISE
jgi:hypothetical protein